MKTWIDKHLIQTNLWVALCFTALLAFFQLAFYRLNFYVLGIAFFGTMSIYNFTRLKHFSEILEFNPQKRKQIILSGLGLLLTLLFVILRGFELKTFLYLAVLGLLSFCYSLPFSGLGLRAIPFLKLFLIAFVWAGASVGLLLVVHHDFSQHIFLFLAVVFFVIGITIPFDIRDQSTDEAELRTIPQIIGIKAAQKMAIGSLMLSGLLFYLEFRSPHQAINAWIATLLVSWLLINRSHRPKSDFYFSFWIESCSLLPFLFYLIFKTF